MKKIDALFIKGQNKVRNLITKKVKGGGELIAVIAIIAIILIAVIAFKDELLDIVSGFGTDFSTHSADLWTTT